MTLHDVDKRLIRSSRKATMNISALNLASHCLISFHSKHFLVQVKAGRARNIHYAYQCTSTSDHAVFTWATISHELTTNLIYWEIILVDGLFAMKVHGPQWSLLSGNSYYIFQFIDRKRYWQIWNIMGKFWQMQSS